MAHKHQIWSSNKATRSAAGRKWRHVANQQVGKMSKMTVKNARRMTRKRSKWKGKQEPPAPPPKPIISIGDIWKNTIPSGS